MKKEIPENVRLGYSKAEIQKRVVELGKEITVWAAQQTQQVVAVPVLRGALFFYADLVRAIGTSVQVAPVRTWAYEADLNGVPKQDLQVNFYDLDVAGRAVLVVDDICDSGRTLAALVSELRKKGAWEIKTAVAITRSNEDPPIKPDWSCFEYKGEEWFVGYGMDDRESWRNLPEIYLLDPISLK